MNEPVRKAVLLASKTIAGEDNGAIFSCWLPSRRLRPVHNGRGDGPRDSRAQQRDGGRQVLKLAYGLGATKSLQAQTDASAFAIASPERMRYSPAALRGGVASIFENKQIAIGKWRKWQLAKP
jgi:hypothetical protein